MKIAIVGAGICGLTAGFSLSQKDHQVTIFEKEKTAGGLAGGFKRKNWRWHLEHYPHHLFTTDYQAQKMISSLGLADKLFFTRPKTSVFLRSQTFQFDSPLSVFSSPVFSLTQKARFGIVTTYLKLTPFWKRLEKITAHQWINQFYGKKASQLLWKPLLSGKFEKKADQIAMSWLWARIKKRSPRLGYLQGGFQILIDRLVQETKRRHGQFFFNHEVKNLAILQKKFEKIIVTTPISAFLRMVPKLANTYQKKARRLKMIGALNLVLVLKKTFLKEGTYWLNVNEKNFPFVFVDEHTNFVNPSHYGNEHLLYVGGYYPQNHRYFKMKKEQIFKEFLPYLQKINPQFDFSLFTTCYSLFTSLYAQPIVPINYSQMILSHKTPIPGVYLANMQQIYPWDRGINYAIKLGEKIANFILE